MKIVKILLSHSKNMSEDSIKAFLYKNMPTEVVTGLEYDDPKTIERALKLLGIESKPAPYGEHAVQKPAMVAEKAATT